MILLFCRLLGWRVLPPLFLGGRGPSFLLVFDLFGRLVTFFLFGGEGWKKRKGHVTKKKKKKKKHLPNTKVCFEDTRRITCSWHFGKQGGPRARTPRSEKRTFRGKIDIETSRQDPGGRSIGAEEMSVNNRESIRGIVLHQFQIQRQGRRKKKKKKKKKKKEKRKKQKLQGIVLPHQVNTLFQIFQTEQNKSTSSFPLVGDLDWWFGG